MNSHPASCGIAAVCLVSLLLLGCDGAREDHDCESVPVSYDYRAYVWMTINHGFDGDEILISSEGGCILKIDNLNSFADGTIIVTLGFSLSDSTLFLFHGDIPPDIHSA